MFLSLFTSGAGIHAAGEDRSPFGDFWFTPVGSRSASGQRVSADTALRMSAVWACVGLASRTLASMPFCLSRAKPGGGRQAITKHPLNKLFSVAPNAFQTPFEWREMLQAHLELRGNAYNQILTDRKGTITALLPLHPDAVKIEMIAGGD